MGWIPTLAALAGAGGLCAFALHMHHRPAEIGKPKMVPWMFIAIACIVAAIVLVGHVIGLATGGQWTGRR
jgi:hypothetical protein